MSIDINDVRDRIEVWEDKLDKWDGVIRVADTTLVDTEKVLAKADEVLEVAQQKADEARELAEEKLEAARELAEENKRHLPKVAIGLAVVGLGVGVIVVMKKRRKAAAEWQVMEQPEDVSVPEVKKTVTKAADAAQEKAQDTSDSVNQPAEKAADEAEKAKDSAEQAADEVKESAADAADTVQTAADDATDAK